AGAMPAFLFPPRWRRPTRFLRRFTRFVGFHRQSLLLCQGLGFRFFRGFTLLRGFLRRLFGGCFHLLGFGLGGFSLGPGRFSLRASLGLGIGQSFCLSLAGRGGGRGVFFRLLLYRHHAGHLGCLNGVACVAFD